MGTPKKHKKKHKHHKHRHQNRDSSPINPSTHECSRRSGEAGTPSPPRENAQDGLAALFAHTTREYHTEKREERIQSKLDERNKKQYDPKSSARELNPYWKNGGSGLPNVEYTSSTRSQSLCETSSEAAAMTEEDYRELLNEAAAKAVRAELQGNVKLMEKYNMELEVLRKEQPVFSSTKHVAKSYTPHKDIPSTSGLSRTSCRTQPSSLKRTNAGLDNGSNSDSDDGVVQMLKQEGFEEGDGIVSTSVFKKMIRDDDSSKSRRISKSTRTSVQQELQRVIAEQEQRNYSEEKCFLCVHRICKPLLISLSQLTYLRLPWQATPIQDECMLVPIQHVKCSLDLDRSEWEDMCALRRSLINMFESCGQRVPIFYEQAFGVKRDTFTKHMVIMCVPLKRDLAATASGFFRKAIEDTGSEWAMNHKLIVLTRDKDIRRSVPKGLSYFWMQIGIDRGYAHVIEDEARFPRNFAQRIFTGMLDVEESEEMEQCRIKSKQSTLTSEQNEESQAQRVKQFKMQYLPYDWTNRSFIV